MSARITTAKVRLLLLQMETNLALVLISGLPAVHHPAVTTIAVAFLVTVVWRQSASASKVLNSSRSCTVSLRRADDLEKVSDGAITILGDIQSIVSVAKRFFPSITVQVYICDVARASMSACLSEEGRQ